MKPFVFFAIAFDPIMIFTCWAPQNDYLNFSFVEDINLAGEKMTINTCKMFITRSTMKKRASDVTCPFSFNESSKFQIFTNILYPSFCQRLLRPADVTFLKTKNIYKKFKNYFQTRLYLHISICQIQFIMSSSIWDTQYEGTKEYCALCVLICI